jgi:hypothetical protein
VSCDGVNVQPYDLAMAAFSSIRSRLPRNTSIDRLLDVMKLIRLDELDYKVPPEYVDELTKALGSRITNRYKLPDPVERNSACLIKVFEDRIGKRV